MTGVETTPLHEQQRTFCQGRGGGLPARKKWILAIKQHRDTTFCWWIL